MRTSRLIATFGGVGLLRPGPGTWGSAVAVPLAWLLHGLGGIALMAIATLAVFIVGYLAARAEEAASGAHDAAEIVIDEVAGMWIALMPLSAGLGHAGADPWVFPWPGWVAGFALFRLFDIWKPGPVGWADNRPGALGVMLDDVIAGAMAALFVAVGAAIAHGVLGI